MQQFLKPTPGVTRAGIIPAELLVEFLSTMDNAVTAFDLRFGREPLAAFAAELVEKSCCSRQSLLPDGFARHITESEPLPNSTLSFLLRSENSFSAGSLTDNPVYQMG